MTTLGLLVFFVFGAVAAPSTDPLAPVAEQLERGASVLRPLDRLLDAEDREVRNHVLLGTAEERQARVLDLQRSTWFVVSWHLQHAADDPRAANLAMRTLVRRKGQLLDAEYDTRQVVRDLGDAEVQAVLDGLLADLEALERARKGDDQGAIRRLTNQVRRRERELVERSRPFRTVAQAIGVGDVAKTLGTRTQLVEFTVYRPYDVATQTFGDPRYAAYTLDRNGLVRGFDLGPTTVIDEAVRGLRGAILAGVDASPRADDLRARILGDLPWVTRAPDVVVAPDGMLHLVPFDLLLAELQDDRFLGGPRLTLLTSGRERLGLGAWKAEPTAPAVVFDVDYGGGRPWLPLPGTVTEGEAIVGHLGEEVTVLRGPAATEQAVAALVRPRILHIASHGFFESQLDPGAFALFPEGRGLTVIAETKVAPEPASTALSAHPALRSGVVLAGANEAGNVITAAEWSNRDLRGTRIVVLSACETGVGEIRNGDGVLGLRRALVLAGSQAQVLSLWEVDDASTAALMTTVYERLASGATIGDALVQAKRRLANQPEFAHPVHWAAFVLSGQGRVGIR